MRRAWIFLLLLAVIAVFAGASEPVHADQGLQITNPIIELQADPGKTYIAKISLLNVTTSDLTYFTASNDFKAKDETGTTAPLLDGYLPKTSSMAKWIQPLGTISIKSKQTKQLEIKIVVPTDAEPGGHYAMVRFSSSAQELKDNGVAVVGSTGPIILARISGNITERLDLKEFFTAHSGKRSGWFETGPITFVERIQNTGNVHVKPVGDLTVTNMFGKNVATLKVNDTKGNILPDSVRRFDQTYNKKWLLGKYSATVSLAYGTKGQVLIGSTSFWVIPYKLILLALIIIIIVILLIRLLLKRYNDKIIRRALDEQKNRKRY